MNGFPTHTMTQGKYLYRAARAQNVTEMCCHPHSSSEPRAPVRSVGSDSSCSGGGVVVLAVAVCAGGFTYIDGRRRARDDGAAPRIGFSYGQVLNQLPGT